MTIQISVTESPLNVFSMYRRQSVFVIAGKISDGEEFFFKFGILILYQDFMCFHIIHMLGYILLNK